MAYSVADLSQAERDLAADDIPLLVGRNWLRSAGSFRGWDADGVTAFSDISATGFGGKFAGDDFDHDLTKPNAAATTQHFIFDYGSEGMTLDLWALLNHNLGTIGGITVTLAVSNDGTTWTDIATVSPGTSNKRLVALVLKDTGSVARRFSSLRYFRMTTAGGSHTPQFGEMILGRRRQLKHAPDPEWDPNNLMSRIGRSDALSGVITDHVIRKGQRKISAILSPHETAYIDDIEAFYETETDFGTRPFLWIDKPNSAPSDASWMRFVEPELSGPLLGPSQRGFKILAIEQGPNFLALGV